MNPNAKRKIIDEESIKPYVIRYIMLTRCVNAEADFCRRHSKLCRHTKLISFEELLLHHFLLSVPTQQIEDYLRFNNPLELPIRVLDNMLESANAIQS